MERAHVGDPDVPTFEQFVAARATDLYRTAYLLTGGHADAEDLVQICLVRLYRAWGRVVAARSPEAYARRVLVNAFVSSRRPRWVTRERLVARPEETVAEDVGPDERLSVWPAVLALPPRQRAVVVLRFFHDLTERETAATLGCATGTVKSTTSAALATLRARLGPDWREVQG